MIKAFGGLGYHVESCDDLRFAVDEAMDADRTIQRLASLIGDALRDGAQHVATRLECVPVLLRIGAGDLHAEIGEYRLESFTKHDGLFVGKLDGHGWASVSMLARMSVGANPQAEPVVLS